jgi:ribosomal protein S12 methylthiotransferase accessory factor
MAPNFRGAVEIHEISLRSAAPLSTFYTLPHGASALERLEDSLLRLFQLASPFAPGLAFVGGQIDPGRLDKACAEEGPINLGGAGTTLAEAVDACLGEAFEFLSQFETEHDRPTRLSLAQVGGRTSASLREVVEVHLAGRSGAEATPLDWLEATRLCDGGRVLVPADLSLRRPAHRRTLEPRATLSTGCAAGQTFATAALRAALELVERDATSLWWIGGRRGRPLGVDTRAQQTAAALLKSLRQGRHDRRSWLLDLTTDLEVPCIAALSVDPDGRALASGFAARTTRSEAAQAAVLEMCQMELGRAVLEAKLQARGEVALNPADRRHLARLRRIDANRCELLAAQGVPQRDDDPSPVADAGRSAMILERVRAIGGELYVADLTRPMFGVPVARAMAPALQLMPSSLIGARLKAAIAGSGGGASHTCGVSLM